MLLASFGPYRPQQKTGKATFTPEHPSYFAPTASRSGDGISHPRPCRH
jgi:hypothetical protein